MKTRWMLVGVMLVASLVVAQQETDDRRGELTAEEKSLAGQELLRSAYDLYLMPDEPLRGQRLVLTAELAAKLAPDNVRIADALGNLYAMREEWDLAAAQYRRGLEHSEANFDLWLTWMTAATNAEHTAEARMAVLDTIARDEAAPNAVRSQALVHYGQLLVTRAREDEAAEIFKSALKFDPYNRQALRGWLTSRESVNTVDQANVMFRMLRACPRDFVVAQETATLLGSVGLWKQSLEYFDYAWTLHTRQLDQEQPPYIWAVEYCNAMIDAGQLTQATEFFTPMLQEYEGALELRSLLIEANNGLNKAQAVRQLIQEVESDYSASAQDAGSYDAEMAMFYLVVSPNSRKALQYARLAVVDLSDEQASEPMYQRLLGGAELLAGSEDTGLARLQAIQQEDIYANVFLADYYYRNGRHDAGMAAVLTGASLGRSGPAFRRLEALAQQYDVEIPSMAGAGSIYKMVTANANYVQMGLEPELFVAVSFVPVDAPFEVGQPIVVDIELKNIGPLPIPTGPEGLFDPKLTLTVTADDGEHALLTVSDLPTATWATPHYLMPDQTVTTRARLDLGDLGQAMDDRLFDSFTLQVEGVLGALVGGETTRSSLPTVEIATLTIERTAFAPITLGEDDSRNILDAYAQAMTRLDAAAGSTDLRERLKAAKQIGLLKGVLFAAEDNPLILPVTGLPLAEMTESLDAMQIALLDDASPLVRAAMLAGTAGESMGERIEMVSKCFGDPSPLVRFCAAEQMLSLRDSTTGEMLTHYAAATDDALLAELAELILAHHESLNEAEDTDDVEFGDETILPEDDGTGVIDESADPAEEADSEEVDSDEAGATP